MSQAGSAAGRSSRASSVDSQASGRRRRHQSIHNVGETDYDKEIGSKPPIWNGIKPPFTNWWMLVQNYLGLNPKALDDPQRQIRFVLGLMTEGTAGDWAQKYYYDRTHNENGESTPWEDKSMEEFETEISRQFTPVDEEINAQHEFYQITQGSKTAADFNLQFQ